MAAEIVIPLVYHHVIKLAPLVPILSHMNSFHVLQTYLFNTHFL